ncbi:selenoprotein H-like [Vigna unguiculata]|uniref:selenoprotein H-like n=1 Tax=Vigna unguiculata TaxID=3917 RepID=UPI001016BCD7|nr:selenoprotein H-like [Vigna unguiculata]
MPPAKRKPAQPAPAAAAPVRVTRAAAKRSALATSDPPPEEKKAKKAKKAKASSGGRKKKNEKEESAPVKADKEEEIEEDEEEGASSKTIVVEHCKQCNQFKMRANLVKERLEKADCGVNVILNPEKPRRGCFEIREEGGKKFISLLDMKRPFKPMRDLDMDQVISDIIDEISNT